MKKLTFAIFTLTLLVFLISSCNNSGNKNNQQTKVIDTVEQKSNSDNSMPDISGKYKMPETSCGYELIITKENGEYNYNIKDKSGITDIFGKASIDKIDEAYYVTFNLPESFSSKTAEGLFENNTITIQNYGNAENEYQYFKDCDEKYMSFVKE